MLSLFLSMPLNGFANLLKEKKGIIGHHNLCVSAHTVEVGLKDSLSSKSSRNFLTISPHPVIVRFSKYFFIFFILHFLCIASVIFLLLNSKLSAYDSQDTVVQRNTAQYQIIQYGHGLCSQIARIQILFSLLVFTLSNYLTFLYPVLSFKNKHSN